MAAAPGGHQPTIGVAGIVGIVGIGHMGLAMALRLLERGWRVRVRDLVAERERIAASHGAGVHADAAAAASGCDALIVAVVDAAQTHEVLFGERGAAPALAPGSAVLICPTIAPQDIEAFAERLSRQGIEPIDAPMSGGPARARDGTMSLMVACDDAVFERRHGLLADLSSRLFRIGTRPGDGARTKLVNNLLAAINLAGAAEAMALAQRIGLDAAATLAVIEQSSGQSWIGSDRLRRALVGDASVQAHLSLLAKDSALALGMARHADADVALGAAAAARFAAACAAGLAQQDDSVLWRWLADAERGAAISPGQAQRPESAP